MEAKLALFAAALALIDAIIPLTLGYAYQEFSSLPSTSSILLLAGLVKLVLLLLPASFIKNPATFDLPLPKRGSFCISDSESSSDEATPSGSSSERPDSPCSPSRHHDQRRPKGAEAPSSAVCLDVQHLDTQQRPAAAQQKRQQLSARNSKAAKQLGGSSRRGSGNRHWPLLLVSAVCSTVASNISLSLIPEAAPYAWSQLVLLQVLAAACLSFSWGPGSSNRHRPGLSDISLGAMGMLLLAVLLGQGIFGGQPASLTAEPEADSILVAATQRASAPAQLPPLHMVGWALLAAVLSAVAMRLLLLARHAGRGAQSSQQELCVGQCALVVLCNLVWYLAKEGSLESFFDDIMAPHEHAILLLGVSGLLSTAIACWPASEALVASGYAYQGAVVLAAWGSGLVLDAPQGGQFACSSFAAGVAVLLLHLGMHAEPPGGPFKGQHSPELQALSQRLHGELKARRFNLQALRDALSYLWVAVTLGLLLVTCWGQFLHKGDGLSFSHPSSAPAMARLGITPAGLMACSDAPFPVKQLYHASIISAQRAVAAETALDAALAAADGNRTAAAMAAAPLNATANSTTAAAGNSTALAGNAAAPAQQPSAAPVPAIPSLEELAKAAAAPAPAWDLCPVLTCSRHPSCSAHNSSCCAHMFVQMAAFWDAFMHSNGLHNQYSVLFDTLTEALDGGTAAPNAGVLHAGVSASALAVLERPCLKTKLWQHGYALFLQGHTWHLCAHRQHPNPLFRQHMHPQRHLVPASAAGSLKLHVMWPYQGKNDTQQLTAVESVLASSRFGGRGKATSTWRLCSSGEVLSMGGGVFVSLDGLRLPRPLGAELSLTSSSWASPTAGSPPVSRARQAACESLVSQLLARLQA